MAPGSASPEHDLEDGRAAPLLQPPSPVALREAPGGGALFAPHQEAALAAAHALVSRATTLAARLGRGGGGEGGGGDALGAQRDGQSGGGAGAVLAAGDGWSISQGENATVEIAIDLASAGGRAAPAPEPQHAPGDALADAVLRAAEQGERLPLTAQEAEAADRARAGGGTGTGTATLASARLDPQATARWLEQTLPFATLFLGCFLYRHGGELAAFGWFAFLTHRANEVVHLQALLADERSKGVLALTTGLVGLHVVGTYVVLDSSVLWRMLLLIPPTNTPSFMGALLSVVVTDTLVRLSFITVKALLLLFVPLDRDRRSVRAQGRRLAAIEYVALLYRAALPSPVWARYLLIEHGWFASLSTGLYLSLKVTMLYDRAVQLLQALGACYFSGLQYGAPATAEDLQGDDVCCAICQDERMRGPVKLRCGHVFCDDCIHEWFERERTCPLCRAVVVSSAPLGFHDGKSSMLVQVF